MIAVHLLLRTLSVAFRLGAVSTDLWSVPLLDWDTFHHLNNILDYDRPFAGNFYPILGMIFDSKAIIYYLLQK